MTPSPWVPYVPDAQQPWDLARAGHLFRRAGFGARWSELQDALSAGAEKTVTGLVAPAADVAGFNKEQDGYESVGSGAAPIEELRGWWLRRMIAAPHPLLERMTLFWHGWFGVGNGLVNSPVLMLGHVRILRAHALGRFDAMLAAALRDPALLLAAGGGENRKAKPNEHFARQVLECFTLGEGQFSPSDVTDTARAFTGWFVRGGQLRVISYEHDDGPKTICGQTGNWTPEDVPRLLLRQPALARRMVRSLCRCFITEEEVLGDEAIEPLARAFAQDFDIAKVTGTILRSQLFYSRLRQRVKSPVEFAVGLCRAFEVTPPTLSLARDLAAMGQELYQPPTIKGWAGGRAWINRATMLERMNLATALLAGKGAYEQGLDPLALSQRYGRNTPPDAVRFVEELLLQFWFPATSNGALPDLRAVALTIASSPEFQLA
jgi:uncharacterized protein (DUF1800 family)